MNNNNNNKIKINLLSFLGFLIISLLLTATAAPRISEIERDINNSYIEGLSSIINYKIQLEDNERRILDFKDLSDQFILDFEKSKNKNWIVTDNNVDTVYFKLSRNENCFISYKYNKNLKNPELNINKC